MTSSKSHELTIGSAGGFGLSTAQAMVAAYHYLKSPVDPRCRPFAYLIRRRHVPLGCLIFGRPEATRCFSGGLTYGSSDDVVAGRASVDRWSVLNLARVWLSPAIQRGGEYDTPGVVPGFYDRRGVWQASVASWAIGEALERIRFDYLAAHPPVWLDRPYLIRTVLSYCDTRRHRGTIYRASGFWLARRNKDGIETWYTSLSEGGRLSTKQAEAVRLASESCPRAERIRSRGRSVQLRLW